MRRLRHWRITLADVLRSHQVFTYRLYLQLVEAVAHRQGPRGNGHRHHLLSDVRGSVEFVSLLIECNPTSTDIAFHTKLLLTLIGGRVALL